MLRYVGVLVLPVRAERIERLDSKDADNAAEHVGLLVVDINELSGLLLDVLPCLANVDWLESLGQRAGGRLDRWHGPKMCRSA